jgi:hypothetical protein
MHSFGTVIQMEVKINGTNLSNKPNPQHHCKKVNLVLVKPISCLPLRAVRELKTNTPVRNVEI